MRVIYSSFFLLEKFKSFFYSFRYYNQDDISFLFAGVPTNKCYCGRRDVSPNKTPGLDALADIINNQLISFFSNPCLSYHYLRSQRDRSLLDCEWTYENVDKTPDDAIYNIKLKNSLFLFQNFWDPKTRQCQPLLQNENQTFIMPGDPETCDKASVEFESNLKTIYKGIEVTYVYPQLAENNTESKATPISYHPSGRVLDNNLTVHCKSFLFTKIFDS